MNDPDATPTPGRQNGPGPAPPMLTCPHCRKDMPGVSLNCRAPIAIIPPGPATVVPPPAVGLVEFFCSRCRCLLGCQFVPLGMLATPPRIQTARLGLS